MIKPILLSVLPWAAGLLLGCGGSDVERLDVPFEGERLDETPPREILDTKECASPQPGASPLRRLTNFEYVNSLLALGLEESRVRELSRLLPSEPVSLGFRNAANTLSVNGLLAQKYRQIGEELGRELAASCEAASSDCGAEFISQMGLVLHRRPLTEKEQADYLALYEKALASGPAEEALSWVTTAMLQSPYFLYRVEIPGPSVERVTGFEMASRLSYTFWQGPPDSALLEAASSGNLQSERQIMDQAVRMLADPKAFRIYEFFEQWLDLDELQHLDRDPELYPNLDPQLEELLRAESKAFVQHLLADPTSTFEDLLTVKYTFANASLAQHYGLSPVEGDAFVRVDHPSRSGILTQGMLAVQDAASHTSIVRRGLKIRTDFLCQLVPAPPDNVDLSLEGIGVELTQAERLEQHRSQPSCSPCHKAMDPIGLAFDGIDAVGRMREADEYGNPLTTDGEILGTIDADGPVSNVHEVAAALSSSVEVEQCYMLQNFRFFFGREAERKDLCTQAQLLEDFRDNDRSLVSLLLAIARSDAFLYKSGLGQDSAESEDEVQP